MTFEAIQNEYRRDLIGPLIYQRVRDLTERYLQGRDPVIYARGAYDYRDGLEDVLHDFVEDVLIHERQIDYVITTSKDLEGFDALIRRQLRRYLARTRARSVVDNLIDRSVTVLRDVPYYSTGQGSVERFYVAGADRARNPSDGEILLAVSLAQSVPKVIGRGEERAPKAYDEEGLKTVLSILMRETPGSVVRGDLQRFFDLLLTPWAGSFLEPTEEMESAEDDLTPDEEALVNDTCQRVFDNMTGEDRVIYQYKFANMPDRQLAEALGLSRQSTAPRKKDLFDRIAIELDGLEPQLQEGVLVRLNGLIASTGLDIR